MQLFIFALICLEYSLGFGGGMRFGMDMGIGFSRRIKDPEPHPNIPQDNDSKDEWFDQKLDHTNNSDGTTWKQRYFKRETFWKRGKSQNKTNMPLFVMIGGEGEASPAWLQGGYWLQPAMKYNALLFELEHRFYGKSHPTKDLSFDNIQYLHSQQALADLVYFIQSKKKEYGMTDNNKVICFGGSYPGNLAAWVRIMYPNVVHASVASSAPVEAKVDFHEYFEVVDQSLTTISGKKCSSTVKEAITKMQKMSKTQEGCNNITKLFSLCNSLRVNNNEDIQMFFNGQGQRMAGVVQYNVPAKPKPANFQVVDMCKVLEDENEPDAMQRYINLNNVFRGQSCVAFSYKGYSNGLRTSTAWDSPYGKEGTRQWVWQTCNEFGYFQTSNEQNSLLSSTVPYTLYTKTCRDAYTTWFTDANVKKRIDYTNSVYKGKKADPNVCYVHGSIDPWKALGIGEDQGAIIIEGTSHCADMNTPSSGDLPSLKAGREKITKFLDKKLQ